MKHCMKKIISLLFLLLTSIVVVVHAVVPHHHHHKLFTSVVDFLGEDTSSLFNHHDAKFVHHVNEVVVSAYYQAEKPMVDVSVLQTYPIDDSFLYQANHLSAIPIVLKPYSAFNYSAVVINSLGLRAPPCS